MKQNKLELKLKIQKFFIEELWQLILVVAFISFCAWLFKKPIEAVLFCISHLIIRALFDKQFHFGTTSLCLCLTFSIGFFGIAVCLPLRISLLSTIPICFGISAIGYVVQDRIDLIKERYEKTKVTLANMTKEQVIEICNELGYNKDKQDIAIMFFVDKLSNKQVWEILCNTQRNVEWDTVNKYKYRITKDFKKIINQREQ